jgi:hypothetical protein
MFLRMDTGLLETCRRQYNELINLRKIFFFVGSYYTINTHLSSNNCYSESSWFKSQTRQVIFCLCSGISSSVWSQDCSIQQDTHTHKHTQTHTHKHTHTHTQKHTHTHTHTHIPFAACHLTFLFGLRSDHHLLPVDIFVSPPLPSGKLACHGLATSFDTYVSFLCLWFRVS